nr:DUF4907 domain-containing protein [Allomuricauda sp.]
MKLKKHYILLLTLMGMSILYLWSDGLELKEWTKKEDDGLLLLVEESEDEQGWMYSIYERERLLIRQEIVPVLEGKQRIPSKEVAEQLGRIVLEKIRSKQMPIISETEIRTIVPFISTKDSIL